MEHLKQIAAELGDQAVLARLAQAEALLNRNQVHIGILGTTNCGKSSLINGILGQTVQEPSMLPEEGKPLRVSFQHGPEDPRCSCQTVFHPAWNAADALLYEINADRHLNSTYGFRADEFDVVFYLIPASRFMTAEDKRVLETVCYLPLTIVLTKLDEVREDQKDRILAYAQNTARDLSAELLVADPENWGSLSQQLRRRVPVTQEQTESRKQHAGVILNQCKAQLTAALDKAIAQEEAQPTLQPQSSRLEQAVHTKNLAAVKLSCMKAENAANEQIRKILPNVLVFTEGKNKQFNKAGLAKFDRELEAYILSQIQAADKVLQRDVRKITGDALDMGLMEGRAADALLKKHFSKQTVHPVPDVDCKQYSVNPLGTFAKTALVVGGVSIASWLLPSVLLSCGITAAAVAVGGVQFCKKQAAEKEETAQALRQAIQKLVKQIQATLSQTVEAIFEDLKAELRIPEAAQAPSGDTDRLAYLKKMKQDLAR